MVLEKREEVKKIFEDFLDDSLLRIILSNPAFSWYFVRLLRAVIRRLR